MPDEADRRYASERGLDPDLVAEGFRDYWRAKAGKEARRVDWHATWRTWVRNEIEYRGRRGGQGAEPNRPSPRGGPRDDSWQMRRLARTRAGGGGYIEGEVE